MVILDTNVMIAFLDKRDSLHSEAVKQIRKYIKEKFYTLNVLIAEAYSVMARRCRERKYNCEKALEILREFENSLEIIWVEDIKERHEKIVEEMIKRKGLLNYNDIILFFFIRRNRVKLLTFDKNLLRLEPSFLF